MALQLFGRTKDLDAAVRFWAVLGLVVACQSVGPETISGIEPVLREALQDKSVGVRLTAAEGLCNLGRYKDARSRFERALAITEKHLGHEHPDLAPILSGLGALVMDLGLYTEAGPLYERALALQQLSLGAHHPEGELTANL